MKKRPILFSAPMVRAILDGKKTQTRRVINPQPEHIEWFAHQNGWCAKAAGAANTAADPAYTMVRCPYGQPGDRLWVRETWQAVPTNGGDSHGYGVFPGVSGRPHIPSRWNEAHSIIYRADGEHISETGERDTWRPSIHMPRRASRITLEVTEVRVQRVQEISDSDAVAEGVLPPGISPERCTPNPAGWFRILWDKINAARGYGWDKNPWVWAVSFEVVEAVRAAKEAGR